MKEQDVRIGMKVVCRGSIFVVEEKIESDLSKVFLLKSIFSELRTIVKSSDFEQYIDIPDTADALNRAVNNLAETLTKTLQPIIDALSRPEVAKALEALGKDKETLREEISKAFEEFRVSGTPYSSFTIFEAGYHAGMKRGDK